MNPYDPIEVAELYAKDGMQSTGYSVRFQDLEEEDPAKRWTECGIVSKNYLLVSNSDLRDVQDSLVGGSSMPFEESKVFFDKRHFMRTLTTKNLQQDIRVGDPVAFGIGVYNSYDGTRAASVFSFINHLRCSNGMVSTKHLTTYRFKHTQGKADWSQETESAFKLLLSSPEQQFTEFTNRLVQLTQKKLGFSALTELREGSLSNLNLSSWGDVMDRYLKGQDWTGMGFLDSLTGRSWHSESWSGIQQVPLFVDTMLSLTS